MLNSLSVLGDQYADPVAAACARTEDCDDADLMRAAIIVAIITFMTAIVVAVGGFMCSGR